MTRILTCGFETGDVNELNGVSGGQTVISVVNAAPTPRAGGAYCIRFGPAGGNNWTMWRNVTIPVRSEIWMRFGMLLHGTVYSGTVVPMQLIDNGGNAQMSFEWNGSDGLLRLRRGNQGTLLVVSLTAPAMDVWHLFEIHYQILTSTTGQVDLYMDGTFQGTFSGQTQNSGILNVGAIQFGVTSFASGVTTNSYIAFDDMAVNDVNGTINNQRIGDGRVVLLLPTAAGSVTTLVRGGADSGANWSQLNELPPSIAQYVGSANPGDRDLYTMSDLPANVTVNCVEAIALAQNTDAGAGSLGMTIHSGATINESAPQALGTSPIYVGARWETDPNTGAAWTLAAVNAVEAGLTVR
jgi:hypothetical protein